MTTFKYFGTDGIRGTVGQSPMTPDFVLRLGYAAGRALREAHADGKASVLIGKDTRISGYMLESALEAGLVAAGVAVHLTGPLPTPAVAYLARTLRMDAGIVISASHNPYPDNGIKFFSAVGAKLSDAMLLRIEALLDEPVGCVAPADIGRANRVHDAAGRYIEFCKGTFPSHLSLRGMRIALDCANGAAYHVAPAVLHELGATVLTTACAPTGLNINEGCGATDTQAFREFVVEQKADIGISLDGDADRIIMVDGDGVERDGDALLYVLALHRHATTGCPGVAGTLMTNLALELALRERGIEFERTKVGDKYVHEALIRQGWTLGGETSGHVLTLDKHTTGDGLVAAVQVLAALVETKQSLAQACAEYVSCPQVLVNVRFAKADPAWAQRPGVVAARARVEAALQGTGRLVLRASGTEPVVRVMVEHPVRATAQALAQAVADALQD